MSTIVSVMDENEMKCLLIYEASSVRRESKINISNHKFSISFQYCCCYFCSSHLIVYSQIDYDQGFMYDVSLQIESEFNGDVKSIVPAEHKRHRRK